MGLFGPDSVPPNQLQISNWFAWSRLRQKSGRFLPDKPDFFDRSSATVKKIRAVWRKTGLFGPDSVPLNLFENK
jgi:hypothetical protein